MPTSTETAQSLIDSIRAEHREDGHSRTNLDCNGVRARRGEILAILHDAGPDLGAWHEVLVHAFEALDSAIDCAARSLPVQQRYSPEAHDTARRLYAEFTSIRSRVHERLGKTELDRALRALCSVGKKTSPDAPLHLHDQVDLMIDALRHPGYAARLEARGLGREELVARLAPGLAQLVAEFKRGPGMRRAKDTNPLLDALRFLDIAFSRLMLHLENRGAEKQARALETLIPRKPSRRRRAKLKAQRQEVSARDVVSNEPRGPVRSLRLHARREEHLPAVLLE